MPQLRLRKATERSRKEIEEPLTNIKHGKKRKREKSDTTDTTHVKKEEYFDVKKEEYFDVEKEEYFDEIDDENDENLEEYDASKYQISELELLRIENIKKNSERFSDFKITEAKHEFSTSTRKRQISVVGLNSGDKSERKKRLKAELAQLPRRTSLRIQKIASDHVALPSNYNDNIRPLYHSYEQDRKPEQMPMEIVNKMEEDLTNSSIKSWTNLCEKDNTFTFNNNDVKPDPDFERYKETMKSLNVNNVGKVTKSRIFSLTVHPMVDKTLAVAGDKYGGIGIWDVGSNDGKNEVYLFEPHTRPINCLKFSPTDNKKLYSCSYDGTIRQGDFEKQNFSQVYGYDEDEDCRFNYFAWLKDKKSSLLAASSNGDVLLIDINSGKVENTYPLFVKSARCIDCHPQNENLFAAACYDGTVATWDIRMLSNKQNKYISYFRASKTISTCFFSPSTGNKLLLTSQDNYLRVFDINKNGDIANPPRFPIRHDNYTGRWLTTFRATWDPKTDNSFICGSMARPRQLDIYGCGENRQLSSFTLQNENFTTITSVNVFHPSKNIIVGGNSSGKIFIWS